MILILFPSWHWDRGQAEETSPWCSPQQTFCSLSFFGPWGVTIKTQLQCLHLQWNSCSPRTLEISLWWVNDSVGFPVHLNGCAEYSGLFLPPLGIHSFLHDPPGTVCLLRYTTPVPLNAGVISGHSGEGLTPFIPSVLLEWHYFVLLQITQLWPGLILPVIAYSISNTKR